MSCLYFIRFMLHKYIDSSNEGKGTGIISCINENHTLVSRGCCLYEQKPLDTRVWKPIKTLPVLIYIKFSPNKQKNSKNIWLKKTYPKTESFCHFEVDQDTFISYKIRIFIFHSSWAIFFLQPFWISIFPPSRAARVVTQLIKYELDCIVTIIH